ncbi:(S)-scoulerine 9-O-methyltransferase-like [Cornus florida]|uniref:(S)-scoulerine 9-O-methyltransferase-like n=1 Tax=Cornus florida TaxID=4283 RepID=UPI0028966A85|nr:(S)-scoulerine 9-O-methyltransferase-like [Cornus florida]XP_059670717.1 (S)-scoulerine 9-O-methyltransferase-like [Cornus florida]
MKVQQGLDLAPLWGMGNLIGTQMTIRAAIELNVFNIISDSGPEAHLSSAAIVSKIPTTNPNAANALERILRMLSANSVLSMSLRQSPNCETNNERTYGLTMHSRAFVTKTDGISIASSMVIIRSERELVESLYKLKDFVLEPECVPFQKTYGVSFYEYVSKEPRLSNLFDENMACISKLFFDMVFKVYPGFEEVEELLDVGGGNGTSLGKIVSACPHIHGINFDLPHVIANALDFPGVEHIAGDMFKSLPNAQAILLKTILHNWDDDRCIMLLRNCWKALPDDGNGKVIVVEFAIQPLQNDVESINTITMDFYMMIATKGGKERTTTEFANLAKAAGFAETKIFSISEGIYVLEFIKRNGG